MLVLRPVYWFSLFIICNYFELFLACILLLRDIHSNTQTQGFANRTKQRNLFIMKNWGSWAAQSEEKQGLQCIGYGVSDVSGLFPRCIFPLWRCSQTAATNGPVNLHGARQSSGCMRSATSWGGGRWIFHHILFLCICLHFVDVPFKESYFLSCAQLIMVHKQSFEKTHMNHLCQQ